MRNIVGKIRPTSRPLDLDVRPPDRSGRMDLHVKADGSLVLLTILVGGRTIRARIGPDDARRCGALFLAEADRADPPPADPADEDLDLTPEQQALLDEALRKVESYPHP